MKRFIIVLISFLLLAIPITVIAGSPDWTLVQIPGSGGDPAPVFFDTDTYLASDITTDINDNLYVMSGSRIIRFTPHGQLDVSWGNKGIIYDDFMMISNCEQLDIAADSRGYVYALCRVCEDGSPTFVKRYAPDGKTDESWYGDGVMGGRTLNGVWVDSAGVSYSGGMRTNPAIMLFKPNGRVYAYQQGYAESESDIINDAGGFRGGSYGEYSISGDTITVKDHRTGKTATWKIQGDTIWAGGIKFVPGHY